MAVKCMNKKGFIDNIFLLVTFIIGFFTIILVSFIFSKFMYFFGSHNESTIPEVSSIINNVQATNLNNDNLLVMFFFGMIIVILITLYFLRSNPVFFVVGLIGLIIVIFLAILLRNTFTDVINSQSDFVSEQENYPKSNAIFEYLPVILLIVLSVFLIFMYANRGNII